MLTSFFTTLFCSTPQVLCCSISQDNQMIGSGSRDGTIRLWRLQQGTQICSFNVGVDIFSVQMSPDKRTIISLADRFGARKLIMLQIVHTKVKSRTGSRCTSPLVPQGSSRPTSPLTPNMYGSGSTTPQAYNNSQTSSHNYNYNY